MKLEQFTQVIETYGSKPSSWPEHLRPACLSLAETDTSAQKLLQEHQYLESVLDELSVPSFSGLESKILQRSLPKQPASILDTLINWLVPKGAGLQLWRPMTAACLPLVFGIAVGNYFSFGVNNESVELESWDDELVLLSLTDLSSVSLETEL